MQPANGTYRLTQTTPPVPGGYSFDVRVDGMGMWCGLLRYSYYPGVDAYSAAPGLTCVCTGEGTYEATSPNGPVSGTCVFVGP